MTCPGCGQPHLSATPCPDGTQWWAGLVECRICTHRWAGVVPIRPGNTAVPDNLTCPNCGNAAGDPVDE